jgi:lipopolysaccharide biosynthesis glycosyltransferase
LKTSSTNPCNHSASDTVVIVTACDENYVLGAAATVRSAIDSLGPHQAARVFVLDGGITNESKARLLKSWKAENVTVDWLRPDLETIRDMPVAGHVSLSTYLRILLAELLPPDVTRAIYLDADTIVMRSLGELWSVPLQGAFCAAAQDAFVPVLDPPRVFSRPLHSMTLPGWSPYPIPNFRDLGLRGDAPYFNAGVMLVNVARWREEAVASRAFECLRVNAAHVRFWDQYPLNTLFSGQWKILDPRWNQNSSIFRVPGWEFTHYSEAEFGQVTSDPWIVHFDSLPKPWAVDSKHPFRGSYFKHLDRTDWHGWRPRRCLRDQAALVLGMPRELYRGYRKWRQTRFSRRIRAIKQSVRSNASVLWGAAARILFEV